MHRLQSASPFFSSNENIKYEEVIISLRTNNLFCNICKPGERCYGQAKYCYEKAIHVAMISFAVVFGIDFSFCESFFVR